MKRCIGCGGILWPWQRRGWWTGDDGRSYWHADCGGVIMSYGRAPGGGPMSAGAVVPGWSPALARLTPTQVECLRLRAMGLTNKAIAITLGLSEPSVKNRMTRIFLELDAESIVDALRAVGWLTVPEPISGR